MNDLCFSIENFIFKHDKKVKFDSGVRYYCHCDRKIDGCPARAIVVVDNGGEAHYKLRKEHNGHAERINDVNSRKFRRELKEAAKKNPEISARQVYDSIMAETLTSFEASRHDEVVASVPDFLRCRSSVQRARRECLPALPVSLNEVNIEGEWSKTYDGERFALFQIPGVNKVVTFTTDSMLQRLCSSPVVIIYVTFRLAPTLFTQLYTLHGEFRGEIFSMMFLLLPDKTKENYEAVLNLIIQAARWINYTFEPETFLLDFELGMMNQRMLFPSYSGHMAKLSQIWTQESLLKPSCEKVCSKLYGSTFRTTRPDPRCS